MAIDIKRDAANLITLKQAARLYPNLDLSAGRLRYWHLWGIQPSKDSARVFLDAAPVPKKLHTTAEALLEFFERLGDRWTEKNLGEPPRFSDTQEE